jgi:predicted PurR-regulated permease PerM
MTQADHADAVLVPGWLQRLAANGWRILVTLALALVLVWIAVELATVSAAILVALIIAATFAPYARRLRGRGWDRTRAAAVVSLVALAGAVAVFGLLIWAFAPYLRDLIEAMRLGAQALADWLVDIGAPPEAAALVALLVDGMRAALTGIVADLVGPIATLVTALILGGFLTFFLLQDGDRAWTWAVSPLQGWRAEAITASGRVALERVGGYLRGTAILAATDGISDFVFLTLLGVPLAAPLAVLVFVGAFVPYVGGFITTSVLVLVTLATNGPTDVLILLGLILVMNLIQGNVMAPMIYGKALDVHPALVLVALPVGAALFGVLGLFAALPTLAFVLAFAPAVVYALDRDPSKRSDEPRMVPFWLDRLGQWSWRGLIVMGMVFVLVQAVIRVPFVVVPVVLAVVLAATLHPTVSTLAARGWGRGRAALAVVAGTVLLVIVAVVVTIMTMIGPLTEMVDTATDGAEDLTGEGVGLVEFVRSLGDGLLATAAAVIADLAGLAVVLLLATLLTFYLLRDGEAGGRRALRRLREPRRVSLTAAGERAAGVLGGYMVGTAIISAFGAASTAVLMVILGLPLALPIAVLSFFVGFIPYLGGFIGTALAFLVTVAVGDQSDIVIMFIWTIVFNIVQGNFVTPLVYGKTVSLHPAIVLLAVPAGNEIAGIIGMFLVVPFFGVVAVTWRSVLHIFDPDDEPDSSVSSGAPPDPHPAPPDRLADPPDPLGAAQPAPG